MLARATHRDLILSAFIISMISPKGGVGKTTTAVLLASEFVRCGKSVALIELDPNSHLSHWHASGNVSKTVQFYSRPNQTEDAFNALIQDVSSNVDTIIIDTPGAQTAETLWATSFSDVCLLPTTFSPFEVRGALTALDAIQSFNEDDNAPGCFVIFTREKAAIQPRARRDILLEFDTAGIPYVLPAILEKEACRQMLTHGCLLHDLPKHAKVSNIEVAFDNVEALLRNIIANL